MTDWGKIIRDLRIEQGMSLRQLATKADVCRHTLRSIESGGRSRSVGLTRNIEAILAALGYRLTAFKVEQD